MRVLGIDPGLKATGYGVVEEAGGKLRAVEFGVIVTSAKNPLAERLHLVAQEISNVITQHRPDCAGVEKVFTAVNAKSALLLGHVRGAILAQLCRMGVPVHEYSALEIKKALVGYGRAQKQQVAGMVRRLLGLAEEPKPADAADALAAAVCHFHSRLPPVSSQRGGDVR
jgi:crossover junction endodeoxyribonuclease RuvC